MNRKIIILFLLLSFPLYSLEIRLNGSLYHNFTDESLQDLSYRLPGTDYSGIFLYELLPLMEEVHSFRFISSDFLMETDPDNSLYITKESDLFYLQNNSIGKIPLPAIIEIGGIQASAKKLIIWFDETDPFLMREIDLFGSLHQVEIEYRVEKNLESLLEYNIFNETEIPDLIIYSDSKLNRLSPLLSPVPDELSGLPEQKKAIPVKLSRQIYLDDSSGGDNRFLTSDFGELNLLYPLFLRFGLEGDLSINDNAVKESFFYLTGLYNQGIYRLSGNPHKDFIEGKADSIYTSSTLLGELDNAPVLSENRTLPNLGGISPPPLLSYRMLSVPLGHNNSVSTVSLLRFLISSGVQQRIDPRTGYLPFDSAVYPDLVGSVFKDLMMEDLEKAIWLKSDETSDKLRIVLPRIYRLIITGRLTIEEGLKEIDNYNVAGE